MPAGEYEPDNYITEQTWFTAVSYYTICAAYFFLTKKKLSFDSNWANQQSFANLHFTAKSTHSVSSCPFVRWRHHINAQKLADSNRRTILHATDTCDVISMLPNTSKHATVIHIWHP